MGQFARGVIRLSEFISGVSLVLMLLLVLGQVGNRIWNIGLIGFDQLVSYTLAMFAMHAFGPTLIKNGHIEVDLVVDRIMKNKRLVSIYKAIIGLCLSVLLIYAVGLLISSSYQYKTISLGMLAIPLWIPQLVLLSGALCQFISFFIYLADKLAGEAEDRRQNVGS